jgi:hypothetical protein
MEERRRRMDSLTYDGQHTYDDTKAYGNRYISIKLYNNK